MRYLLIYELDVGTVVGAMAVPFSVIPEIPAGRGVWCASSPQEWERASRVTSTGLELVDKPLRHDPAKNIIPESQCLQIQGHYRAARREEYDPIPEQLDRITKALAHLKDCGVDIGEDGDRQVDHCQSVKSRFPKPVL